MEDAEKETAEGTGGTGHPPEHSTDAAAATTKIHTHQRREYGKEATAALVGGQGSVVLAPA